MLYIYKKNLTYIYKRRIPNLQKFYVFNTKIREYKRAYQFAIIYNSLVRDFFDYIKQQGKDLSITFTEISTVLNDYKKKALNQYEKLEEDRHKHLEKLFKIEVKDDLLGKIRLNGASMEVSDKARKSFHNLAVGSYFDNEKPIIKYGKEIIQRATNEVKQLFKEIREEKDKIELLNFLSLLLKTEAEIIGADYALAHYYKTGEKTEAYIERTNSYSNNSSNNSNTTSMTEQNSKNHKLLTDLEEEFLFTHNNYKREDITDSKSQVYKRKTISTFFIDYMKKKYNNDTAINLDITDTKDMLDILIHKENKSTSKNKASEKRTIKTIGADFNNLKAFIEYLLDKDYYNSNADKLFKKIFSNAKKTLDKLVANEEIKGSKDIEAFNIKMLQCIFNIENNTYRKVCNVLTKKTKLRSNQKIENYWARFYIPILLFFTGARVSEIAYLKAEDCEIFTDNNEEEHIILYILSNEERALKTKSSRRAILLHRFLSNDLGFKKFIENAQLEKKEYLFNTNKDISKMESEDSIVLAKKSSNPLDRYFFNNNEDIGYLVSKEFNRDKECIENNTTRLDTFNNAKYTLHSFRHSYKTHMTIKIGSDNLVDKLQGHFPSTSGNYLAFYTPDIIDTINKFELHNNINWNEIIKISKLITEH